MRYVLLAMLIFAGIVSAHNVTVNFAVRIDDNLTGTIHVNDTNYDAALPVNIIFSTLGKRYILLNKTNTIASIVSAGNFLGAYVNSSYYKKIEGPSTVLVFHMDNST